MDTRKDISKRIKALGVSKALVAKLSRVHRPDFINWTNGNEELSQQKLGRVIAAVDALEKAAQAVHLIYPGVEVNWKDAGFVARLIEQVQLAEKRIDAEDAAEPTQPTPPDIESLRLRPA